MKKVKSEYEHKNQEYNEFKMQQARRDEALGTGQSELEVQEQIVASLKVNDVQ